MDTFNYLKKSITTGVGNSAGSALISLLAIPLIIGKIGIENYGILAMLAIFGGISSMAELGIGKTLIYFIPKVENIERRNDFFTSGLLVNTLVLLFIGLAGVSLFFLNVNILGSKIQVGKHVYRVLYLCGLSVFCLSLSSAYLKAILEASYKIYQVNIISLLSTLAYYLCVYILAVLGCDIVTILIGVVLVSTLAWGWHLLLVFGFNGYMLCIPNIGTIKEILKHSTGFLSWGLITSSILPINRYLLVVLGGDVKAYGVFDIALKIVSASNTLLASFSTPLYSLFSGYAKGGFSEIRKMVFKYLSFLSVSYVLGVSLFYVAGEFVSAIFIKQATRELYLSTLVMLIFVVPVSIVEPITRAFWSIGGLWFVVKVKFLQPFLNIIVYLCLDGISPIYRFSIAYSFPFLVYAILIFLKFCFDCYRYDRKSEHIENNYGF